MEVIDALKELQALIKTNDITDYDYEEIRRYALLEPDRTENGFTTNRAISNLRRLYDSSKISLETFNFLKDKVALGFVNKEVPTKSEPPIRGPLVGFLLGFLLNFVGLILCVIYGDKKAKVASTITTVIELALGLIITVTLVCIFVTNPNIIFPQGL